MKRTLVLSAVIMAACTITGCTSSLFPFSSHRGGGETRTEVYLDGGTGQRMFSPCSDSRQCYRETYDLAWDSWCSSCNYSDIRCRPSVPVTYRSKQVEYDGNRVEYVFTPRYYRAN